MSVNVTTSANGEALNGLITQFILGAQTIDQGLVRIVPNQMNTVALQRFQTALDQLVAPVPTPVTPNDSMTKDEVIVTTGDAMFYDEYNPLRDFEDDWRDNWSTGGLTEAQAAAQVRTAIMQTVTESVQDGVEKLTWQGDTLSADAWLNRTDGFEKLIEANGDVNTVANIGLVDKTNILEIMEAVKNGARPDLLASGRRGSLKFILSYVDFQHYMDALRDAGISKGINIMDGDVPTFAGIPVYQTGISASKICLTVASTGTDSNLVGATWMWSDTRGVKIERLQANSELFFAKVLFKLGFNVVYGSDISYYVGAIIP